MKDDLEKFHARNMANDPQYAVARQLLELGEAVAQLRAHARLTRGELAKRLGVKARDIAVVEEETPRASAGLLEATLSLLLQMMSQRATASSATAIPIRTIKHLRPALVPV